MHLGDAISALEEGLKLEAAGEAANMVKTHAVWGGHNTLHAIGATFEGAGFVGTKTWGHTSGGATPLLILWDSGSGELKAVIEAFALGQMRTGAMSGVATRWLAEACAHDMAVIGTGKQALTQVAAVAAVRPLTRVRVYSPSLKNRAAFADKLTADNVAGAKNLSKEYKDYYDGGPGDWADVKPISEVVAAAGGRPPGADLTLFKAMGMGVSDLSLGIRLHDAAVKEGVGREIPHPTRAKPRLRGD